MTLRSLVYWRTLADRHRDHDRAALSCRRDLQTCKFWPDMGVGFEMFQGASWRTPTPNSDSYSFLLVRHAGIINWPVVQYNTYACNHCCKLLGLQPPGLNGYASRSVPRSVGLYHFTALPTIALSKPSPYGPVFALNVPTCPLCCLRAKPILLALGE